MKNQNEILNNYKPEIFKTAPEFSDSEISVTMYGIRFIKNSQIISEFPEISDNFNKVQELYSYFFEYDIDETHILDVVLDFVENLYSI